MVFVATWMDDLIFFFNDFELQKKIKLKLTNHFHMKDLGETNQILGIRISRDKEAGVIWIDQETFVDELLKRFNMEDCNTAMTPFDHNQKLTKDMCPKNDKERENMSNVPYMSAVGSLVYAAQVTRPDIGYPVNVVSRFCSNPGRVQEERE